MSERTNMNDVSKMTNSELAQEVEDIDVAGYRRDHEEQAHDHAVKLEAARRLRDSVPRDLYQKAWEECQDMREREPVTSSTNPGIIHCREAHDLARTAQGEK